MLRETPVRRFVIELTGEYAGETATVTVEGIVGSSNLFAEIRGPEDSTTTGGTLEECLNFATDWLGEERHYLMETTMQKWGK